MKYLTVLLVSVLLLTGCGKKPRESPAGEKAAATESPFEELQAKIAELSEGGRTNAIIDELSAALENDFYAEDRQQIFSYLLDMLLSAGRIDEARERYLRAIETDEDLARSGFGMIGQYYASQGNTNALMVWVETLVRSELPDDVAERAFSWHIFNKVRAGLLEDALSLAPQAIERFEPKGATRILSSLKAELLSAKNYDATERLLAEIEKSAGDARELQDLVAVGRVELHVGRGEWDQARDLFLASAASLDDNQLRGCFSFLAGQAQKQGKRDVVDSVCVFVLSNHADNPTLVRDAARRWVQIVSGEDLHETAQRLKTATMEYLPAADGLSLYRNHFYGILENGGDEDRQTMLEIGHTLATELSNDSQKDVLKALLFDGSFLMKDYDAALAALEEGLPNRDDAWHAMAINKLKAHQALDAGNTDEAVERFRKFMQHVEESWTEPEYDPSTGLMHTREMALGFNARRIGDILRDAGQVDAAAEVYAEARAYYEDASGKLKPDSKEYAAVQEILVALPVKPATGEETEKAGD